MARFNLRFAAQTVEVMAEHHPDEYAALCRRTSLEPGEVERWVAAADAMFLPYDETQGIHPQDDAFLDLEPWDFEGTPADRYPLLLHFHPLVIYRHQVLKQADVVLAMFLRGEHFTTEQKRRNFEYYDPITTGDSSLSACVQGIVAADVGHPDLAFRYFLHALYLDLLNTHGNTPDGVHIASAGGVWAGIVNGFGGMRDNEQAISFAPRLPERWSALRFRLVRHGSLVQVELDHDGCTVNLLDGDALPVETDDGIVLVHAGESLRIPA